MRRRGHRAVRPPVYVRARQVLRRGPRAGELGQLERVGEVRVPRG